MRRDLKRAQTASENARAENCNFTSRLRVRVQVQVRVCVTS